MKNIEEAVNMHIMEKNMETANGEEPGAIFQTALTQEDLNSLDFPIELKQEILYVRAKLTNSEITTTPSDYNAGDLTTDDLFFVDSSIAEGKEKAYVYDEQSKSVYKAKPTIISGKAMFGYDYGKIIGVQGLLAQPVNPTPPTQNEGWTGIVNAPKIGTSGLIPVTIDEITGAVTEVTANSTGWYDYKVQGGATPSGGDSHWANAITKNSSNQITGMFVWIPRFAYKITSGFKQAVSNGTIDVVFLKETTDKYELDGVEYTARRLSEEGVDTNKDYYVIHPCFTKTEANGVKTYEQGEWDEELEGIWVAKFEAGFAGGGNSVTQINSTITYGENCTTNFYNKISVTAGSTPIPYPVFLPNTYSFNYITQGDIFRISQIIGDGNSYYKLNNTDSHMMKNSEWGAVAYLTQSQYGRAGTEIAVNNINKNDSSNKIYAVTGYSTGTATPTNTASISDLYKWTTDNGKLASTTGNVYGVYDLSGGTWEYTSNLLSDIVSDKYRTIYTNNTEKRGDAIYETASWNSDYSYFYFSGNPFLLRGGFCEDASNSNGTSTGIFAYSRNAGTPYYYAGWRAVLAF